MVTSTKALKIGREKNESQLCNQGLQLCFRSRFPHRPVLQESLQLQQPFRCDRHSHGLRIKLPSQAAGAGRRRYSFATRLFQSQVLMSKENHEKYRQHEPRKELNFGNFSFHYNCLAIHCHHYDSFLRISCLLSPILSS